MKTIVAIFNIATGKYLPPRVTEDTTQAMKEFYMLFNEKSGVTLLTTYPQDYELRELGEFDEEIERAENYNSFLQQPIILHEVPITIVTGKDAKLKWEEEK